MENRTQTRRKFLATLAFCTASAACLWRYLTPPIVRSRTVVARARKDDVPVEGGLIFREERVALLREGDKLYALSLVCTHLGCTVNVTPAGLECPCHGSRFDRQGEVLKGPADRPLARLDVVERDGFAEVMNTSTLDIR